MEIARGPCNGGLEQRLRQKKVAKTWLTKPPQEVGVRDPSVVLRGPRLGLGGGHRRGERDHFKPISSSKQQRRKPKGRGKKRKATNPA